MTDLIAIAHEHIEAVIDKRVEEIIDRYAASAETYVFLEGPRWSTISHDKIATGWRAFVDAPMSLVAFKWTEGPLTEVVGDMGWVAGIIELSVRFGDEVKTLALRGTYVMRCDADGKWRISHEHFSQPLADPYGIGDWLKKPE